MGVRSDYVHYVRASVDKVEVTCTYTSLAWGQAMSLGSSLPRPLPQLGAWFKVSCNHAR